MFKSLVKVGLVLGLIISSLSADTSKIDKRTIKWFKYKCGTDGIEVAKKNTAEEWKNIYDNKKFTNELKKYCPKIPKDTIYGKKTLNMLYDYIQRNVDGAKKVTNGTQSKH